MFKGTLIVLGVLALYFGYLKVKEYMAYRSRR